MGFKNDFLDWLGDPFHQPVPHQDKPLQDFLSILQYQGTHQDSLQPTFLGDLIISWGTSQWKMLFLKKKKTKQLWLLQGGSWFTKSTPWISLNNFRSEPWRPLSPGSWVGKLRVPYRQGNTREVIQVFLQLEIGKQCFYWLLSVIYRFVFYILLSWRFF